MRLLLAATVASTFTAIITILYPAHASEADASLVKYGEYLAIAADCSGCHNSATKGLMAGGLALHSPMGDIFAPNITPDKKTGIGSWSEKQFADALRRGISPTRGSLYPAMPYTAYNGLIDKDIHALYSYFMLGVPAIENASKETHLPFPFFRIALPVWNYFYNRPYKIKVRKSFPQLERGRYLVDHLAHCSTCHTPRNFMLAERQDAYLGGGKVWPWTAPNITPSEQGIGEWTTKDIRLFLTEGHNQYAVAGGDMGLTVQQSLSHLTDDDIYSIALYLKSIPAYTNSPDLDKDPPKKASLSQPVTELQFNTEQQLDDQSLDGSRLYQAACSSCHGVYGEGSQDGEHPSLWTNDTIRMKQPDNLINIISYGVHYRGLDQEHAMPGFVAKLNSAQIASLTNYVRNEFSGQSSQVTAEYVKKLSLYENNDYFIIKYVKIIIILAIMCLASLITSVLFWIRRKGG
ncbi:c-type cytochrome [Acetobacteraceae bacterium ESL0709]|nr:c-type cytochrome [Acetobacteraceae bacterium ESL0697]MDF7678167.1 c-type cytochrome [Acetobacteraceae bacterium ESL0709]